jgi:hypothetical protein
MLAVNLKKRQEFFALKGRNGVLASTACTISKTVLSLTRNAHFEIHNREKPTCGQNGILVSTACTFNMFMT